MIKKIFSICFFIVIAKLLFANQTDTLIYPNNDLMYYFQYDSSKLIVKYQKDDKLSSYHLYIDSIKTDSSITSSFSYSCLRLLKH